MIRKILILIASSLLLIAAGSYALYPIYSGTIKNKYNFSMTEMNFFSMSIDVGFSLALPMGYINDRFNHKICLIISVLLLSTGYIILQHLISVEDYPKGESGSIFPFIVTGLILGQGAILAKITVLSVNLKNFKFDDTSKMIGLLMSNMAVSASIFTSYKQELLHDFTIQKFFIFVIIFVAAITILCLFLFKVIKQDDIKYTDFQKFKEHKIIDVLIYFNLLILALYAVGLLINNHIGSSKVPNFIIFPILKCLNFIVILAEVFKCYDEELFKRYIDNQTLKEQARKQKNIEKHAKLLYNKSNKQRKASSKINDLKIGLLNVRNVSSQFNNINKNNNTYENKYSYKLKSNSQLNNIIGSCKFNENNLRNKNSFINKFGKLRSKSYEFINSNNMDVYKKYNLYSFNSLIKNRYNSSINIFKKFNNVDCSNSNLINSKKLDELKKMADINLDVINFNSNTSDNNDNELLTAVQIENDIIEKINIPEKNSKLKHLNKNSNNLDSFNKNSNIVSNNLSNNQSRINNNLDYGKIKETARQIREEISLINDQELIVKNAINELEINNTTNKIKYIKFKEVVKTKSVLYLFIVQMISYGIIHSNISNINYIIQSLVKNKDELKTANITTSTYDLIILFFIFNSITRLITGIIISNLIKKNMFYSWVVLMTICILISQLLGSLMNKEVFIISISLLGIASAGLTTFTAMFVRLEFGTVSYGKILGFLYVGDALGVILISHIIFMIRYKNNSNQDNLCYGKDCFKSSFLFNSFISLIAIFFSIVLYRWSKKKYLKVLISKMQSLSKFKENIINNKIEEIKDFKIANNNNNYNNDENNDNNTAIKE